MSLSWLTASTILCQTPASPQRLKRVYVVCQLPNSAGKSRRRDGFTTFFNGLFENVRFESFFGIHFFSRAIMDASIPPNLARHL
jgi:hypothetical protein